MTRQISRAFLLRVHGFTLVELIVALSIVTVMLGLVFSGLRLGARVWDSVEQRMVALHEDRLVAQFIVHEIEQARAIWFEPRDTNSRMAFFGSARAVRFVAPLPSQAGGGGLRWVGLELVQVEEVLQLVLTYELFQPGDWERYGAHARDRLVLYERLVDAEFAYFGALGDSKAAQWAGGWDDPDKLPKIVRLRLKHEHAGSTWQELYAVPRMSVPPSGRRSVSRTRGGVL